MKAPKSLFLTVLALVLSTGVWGQVETASNTAPANGPAAAAPAQPAPQPVTAADIQALKDALAAQQLQIQALQEQLQRKNQVQQLTDAPQLRPAPQQVAAISGIVVQPEAVQTPGQEPSPDAPQTINKEMEGPLTLHFRGINITPGGYVESAFIRRSHALFADLSTPFNSVPMPGASQSQVSEFFGSGRQSKITTFVDGRLKNVDLSAYVSADFLSAGVTSTSNQTNGYTLRLRQAWGQAKFTNGWSFLGGQIWSLVTENGKGISPDDDLGRTNDARPKTIDPSYNVGFDFARQYGIRLTKSFGDKFALAVGLENPQATLGTHGNVQNFLLGSLGASNSYNTTATYSFNPSPDLIAKVAFDPGFGHYEVFGLFDRFTDRQFPCEDVSSTTTCLGSPTPGPNPLGGFNSSRNGGGVGASARFTVAKHVTFGVKGFDGSGIGRYAPAGLPDVSINPNGSLHLIKNLHGLSTLELHFNKLDVNLYSGVEYAARSWGFDKVTGNEVGYGGPGFTINPFTGATIAKPTFNNSGCSTETGPGTGGFAPGALSSCTSDTRAVIEGTAAVWYKFYSGPRGRFQFGVQYSYLTRNTWSAVEGGAPHGIDNMVFTSFRYYLP